MRTVISGRPVHGPAWPVSYGLVTQAGRCVAGPDWVGFQRVAAGLINCWVGLGWVGLVRTVLAVYTAAQICTSHSSLSCI